MISGKDLLNRGRSIVGLVFIFAKALLSEVFFANFPAFHFDMVKNLLYSKAKITVIEAMRGSGKSVICTFLMAIFAGVILKLNYIVIVSASRPKSEEMMNDIKRGLTSPLFVKIFGNLIVKSDKDVIYIEDKRRGISCLYRVRSMETQFRGLRSYADRPDLYIFDDVDSERVSSGILLQKYVKRFVAEVLPSIKKRDRFGRSGRVWVVNNPVARDSFVRQIHKLRDTVIYRYPAILIADDGTEVSLWPDMYPLEDLQNERYNLTVSGNKAVWDAEYMCDPKAEEDVTFPNPVYYYKADIRDVYIPVRIAVDMAYSLAKRACKTSICAGGYDADKTFYVLDIDSGKFLPEVFVDRLIKMIQKFDNENKSGGANRRVIELGIESKSYPYIRAMVIAGLEDRLGRSIPIVQIKETTIPKIDRIGMLIPLAVADKLLIPEEKTPSVNALESQMLSYPYMSSMDELDSVELLNRISVIPNKNISSEKKINNMAGYPVARINERLEKEHAKRQYTAGPKMTITQGLSRDYSDSKYPYHKTRKDLDDEVKDWIFLGVAA